MPSHTPGQLLPHSVDALKFCQQRASVTGSVLLAALPRLSAELQRVDGIVQVELVFGLDEQSRKVIQGRIEAVLPLLCQRCMQGLDVPVSVDVQLGLVWTDEQAVQLPRSLDPVQMETQEMDLYAIVEEELLLAMPLVAHHEQGVCEPPQLALQPQAEMPAEIKDNPFQVLAALKSVVKNSD